MASEAELRLRERLSKLKSIGLLGGTRLSGELERLQRQLDRITAEPSEDDIWRSVELARHQDRPYTLDYVELLLEDWVELHGDRARADDAAVICAIAASQATMMRLATPIVSCVIGEGGSGGAIAIAVGDRVLMQENAIYSVISPEGCAAILWRDASEAKKAAAAFKPDARHCLDLGVIDAIVPEPEGGAHTDVDEAARLLGSSIREALADLEDTPADELARRRRARFRSIGVFA